MVYVVAAAVDLTGRHIASNRHKSSAITATANYGKFATEERFVRIQYMQGTRRRQEAYQSREILHK